MVDNQFMCQWQNRLTVWEMVTVIPVAVYPLALLTLIVGNLTGDYSGLYAQTELAAQIQWVTIPLMMIAPLIWMWGWSDDR